MAPTERHVRASEEAGDWWLRLQADDLPREQREQFVDWLRESPLHVREMLSIASVHGSLERFERWLRITTDGAEQDSVVVPLVERVGEPAPEKKKSRTVAWAIAATAACVAIAVALLLPGLRGQIIQTDRGERREVALADGSVVQIDPETRLRVKLEDHSRQIYLETGRALFRVAKDASRPFFVHADTATVRAVGTAFAVEHQQQGVVVTVAEGKVAVEERGESPAVDALARDESSRAGKASTLSASPERSSSRILLVANEQVTVRRSAALPEVHQVDSERALAWAEGRLVFEDTTVAEVVAQFNRYNNIQIQIEDARLAQRPISGVFNAANPDSFIDFIRATANVQVSRNRGSIVIAAEP